MNKVQEYRIRLAKRRAKQLGLNKLQTMRLVARWAKQGAK